MRSIKTVLVRRVIDLKKQNCSAPFTLSVFLIACMIMIFSLESLGILQKEKNLDYRLPTPEVSIRLLDLEGKLEKENKDNKNVEKLYEEDKKIDTYSAHVSLIQDIILDAVRDEIEEQFKTDSKNEEYEDDLDFFDV